MAHLARELYAADLAEGERLALRVHHGTPRARERQPRRFKHCALATRSSRVSSRAEPPYDPRRAAHDLHR